MFDSSSSFVNRLNPLFTYSLSPIALGLLFPCSYVHDWLERRPVKTVFAHAPTLQNMAARLWIQSQVRSYTPTVWYNAHLVSLLPFGTSTKLSFDRRFYVNADHTNAFAVDWYPAAPNPNDLCLERIVLMLPGLGQRSDAPEVQAFVRTHTSSSSCCCGILNPRIGRPWHPALLDDLQSLFHHLTQLFSKPELESEPEPEEPKLEQSIDSTNTDTDTNIESKSKSNRPIQLFLAGFSGSSTIITRMLARLNQENSDLLRTNTDDDEKKNQNENQKQNKNQKQNLAICLMGAFCCCFVCNYAEAKQLLEESVVGCMYSRFLTVRYQTNLTKNLVADTLSERTMAAFPGLFNYAKSALAAGLLSEHDRSAFSLYGYTSLEEMHRDWDTTKDLAHISIPTLFMQPADDPLYTLSYGSVRLGVPLAQLTSNPLLMYMEPSHGAHLGFVDTSDPYSYAPKVALAYFDVIAKAKERT